MVTGIWEKNITLLNFALGSVSPCELVSSSHWGKNIFKIRGNYIFVDYFFFPCCWESNYGHTVGLVERLAAPAPLRKACVNKT